MKAQTLSILTVLRTTSALSIFAAIAACSPANPYMHGPDATVQTAAISGGELKAIVPKADILFVIDDSLSMDDHQLNVSKNIDGFVDAFKDNQVLDYHMAVTQIYDHRKFGVTYNGNVFTDFTPIGTLCPLKLNTLNLPVPAKDKNQPSVMQNPCDTRNILTQPIDPEFSKSTTSTPCTPADHTKAYITRNTCGGMEALRRTMKMGTRMGPEFEEVFSPALAVAQSPSLNAGFLRPDATLIVIFVTDADDSTLGITPAGMYAALVQAKGGDASKVKVIGAISTTASGTSCEKDHSGPPTLIEEFLRIAHSEPISLCSPNFGAQMAAVGNEFSSSIAPLTFKLPYTPDLKTLVVRYGNDQVIRASYANGYFYDSANQTISISGHVKINPQPGAEFHISFDATKAGSPNVHTVGTADTTVTDSSAVK